MADVSKHQQKLETWVAKECAKSGAAEVVSCDLVYANAQVSTGENVKELLKASLLGGGKLRTDSMQVFTLKANGGEFFLVVPWSRKFILPHEFASLVPGRVPGSIILRSGMIGWDWHGLNGGKQDPMAQAAKQLKKSLRGINWTWNSGNYKMDLPWNVQVVPLNDKQFLFIEQTARHGLLQRNFGIEPYLQNRQKFCDLLHGISLPGESLPDFLAPILSIDVLGDRLSGYDAKRKAA